MSAILAHDGDFEQTKQHFDAEFDDSPDGHSMPGTTTLCDPEVTTSCIM